MRRRQFLRTAAGLAGFTGLSAASLRTTGRTAGADPATASTDSSPVARSVSNTTTATATTATETDTATNTDTPTGPTALSPLGGVELEGVKEVATDASGEYAYVATTSGFAVVDLSDPGSPSVVAQNDSVLEGTPAGRLGNIYDLSVSGDRLLVGGPGGFGDTVFRGLVVFDVSDPASPERLRRYAVDGTVHNCHLEGRFAYFTGDGLEIVDVGREEPGRLATWEPADHDEKWDELNVATSLHDMWVVDDRAYLAQWDAGAWLLDVSDPTEPTAIGRAGDYTYEELRNEDANAALAEPPGNAHYVQPSGDGDLLAVGAESWDVDIDDDTGGPSGIDLYDVSEPADPQRLATIDPPEPPEDAPERSWTTAHNFDLSGDYIYASWYVAGVTLHDISDPSSPRLVGGWQDAHEEIWAAEVGVPGEFFLASSMGPPQRDRDGPGAVVVLPDPTDQTPTTTAEPTATYTFGTDTPTRTPAATPTATPTDTPTPSPTPTETETGTATGTPTTALTPTTQPGATTQSDATTETSSGEGPGFGALAGLSALSVGAWRVLRETEGDGD